MLRDDLTRIIFTSALILLFRRAESQQGVEPRIVGGYNVTSMEGFKHQVSIRSYADDRLKFGNGHRCGGSLISLRTVLTAAHCVHNGNRYLNASSFIIAMGMLDRWIRDQNTLYIPAAQVVGHKSFKMRNFDNDIAVIRLATEVPLNHPTVEPIALSMHDPIPGQICIISGWGTTAYENGIQPDRLKAANLTINSKSECNQPNRHNGNVLRGMFCAGPFAGPNIVDSCQGDSGGPLTCGGILVGITSNGVACALPNYPGIYIDVNAYRKWIYTNHSSTKFGSFVIILIAVALSSVCGKLY